MTTTFFTARRALAAATLVAGLLAGTAVNAATVTWADWTGQTSSTHVDGTLTVGMDVIDVDYDGAIFFTQTSGAGTDYWIEPNIGNDYTEVANVAVVNRPTGTDLIALSTGGLKTITFSQAVVDPFLAFTSWNGNNVTFSSPFTVISQGRGFWGTGSFVPSNGNLTFVGSGEVHGVLQFKGTFTQLSFTDTSEGWHGFTVGVGGVAGGVPEPATWALMIGGFGAAGAMLRRRRAFAA